MKALQMILALLSVLMQQAKDSATEAARIVQAEIAKTSAAEVMSIANNYGIVTEVKGHEKINDEMAAVITAFENLYFKSLGDLNNYYLPSSLYEKPDGYYALLMNAALDNLIKVRKTAMNDCHMNDVQVTLNIVSSKLDSASGIYKVTVNETSRMHFACSSDYESVEQNVLHYFYLRKSDSGYLLTEVYKEQGNYLFLERNSDNSNDIAKAAEKYMTDMLAKQAEIQTMAASGETYAHTKTKIPYDGEKAAAYSNQYALSRNMAYNAHSSNCMNFISQCLNAGGIAKDYSGSGNTQQWKSYGGGINMTETARGYTTSWTSISRFNNYVSSNKDRKIVLVKNVNIFQAEKGDLVYCSWTPNYYSHIVMVGELIKDGDGKIKEILINGNTNDQYNFPLSAFVYPYWQLTKVEGCN